MRKEDVDGRPTGNYGERDGWREEESGNSVLSERLDDNDNNDHGGARGVMFIVVGNGHGDTGSNPTQDWLHFT